jgi:predicted RNA-binding protein YlqC (UPF0109 family)
MSPNYAQLLSFVLTPLLEQPEALRLHQEVSQKGDRVWLRLAVAPNDRGKVLGKGGKNMQVIRTILTATAKNAGHSLNLELYEAGRN